MRKYLYLLPLCLLLGAESAPVVDTKVNRPADMDIKFKKLFDEFESRIKKHLKTKKITLPDAGDINWTQTRYLSISPVAYSAPDEGEAWTITFEKVESGNTTALTIFADVNLPHGAVVTSFKSWWYRDDVAADGGVSLRYRLLSDNSEVIMAATNSDATTGIHTVEDTTITGATIDNSTRKYSLRATIEPNDAAGDVYLIGHVITYTISKPLP